MGLEVSGVEPLPVIVLEQPFPRESVARAAALVRTFVAEAEETDHDD